MFDINEAYALLCKMVEMRSVNVSPVEAYMLRHLGNPAYRDALMLAADDDSTIIVELWCVVHRCKV
jgi:hypothetical protein